MRKALCVLFATVMAMLIAWQAINAARQPNSSLFSRGFLIVAPGITIKDRLRVLKPSDGNSYYRSRELVPQDMMPDLNKAKIEIGMTYLEKNDFANAEKTLMEVAQSVNANREVFYNLGEVKFAKGETDEAVKYYERAAQMDANWGKPLFKLGLAKLQKADTAGAIEYMNKVIAQDPNSAEAAQAKALIEQLKKG